jgi:Ax21 family sulfation-dependent quorum factor
MKRTFAASFLALTCAAANVDAADLDYSYIEAGYSNIDIDNGPEADGWSVGGSAAVSENFHVFGSYTRDELDQSNVEIRPWRIGLGWNRSISDGSDLVVRANYLDFSGSAIDVDGWETEVGVRSALTANFETYVALGYGHTDGPQVDSDGDIYGRLGAQYKFNPRWGVTASATLGEGSNEYFIGPRLSF